MRPSGAASAADDGTPQRLFNRHFLLLWQGQTVSGVGISLSQIATVYWLLQETGSATTMGLVSMAAALPGVILGPVGGAIADRYSRKRLIVIGDCLLGVAALCLGFAFLAVDGAVGAKVAALVVSGVLTGIVSSFFRPAVMASIPNLVPTTRLSTANAMNSFSMTASMGIGTAIGGVLFRLLGAPALFLANGVTYLVSALSETFIRVPQTLPQAPPSMRALFSAFVSDVATGLGHVWNRPGLRNMVLAFAVLNLVSAPTGVLLPILLDQHRGLAPDWFGYLMAAMAAGNVAGMAFAGVVRIDGPARLAYGLTALFTMAAATFLIGVAESPYLLLAANAVNGVFMGIMTVAFTTLMQATTPDELRGRVMSVMMTVIGGTVPLAMGLAGVLADAVDQNVPLLFMAAGALTACVATVVGCNRPFREFIGTRLLGV